MSTNEGTTRYKGRGKYANSLGGKIYGKADTTNGQTCTRPHFELHTKSSLLKRKEPREYTMMNLKGLRKPEGNRVSKKRSTVVKQSKSMQTLKTVLTREKDLCQMLDSLSNKCSETEPMTQSIKQVENSCTWSWDGRSKHSCDTRQSTADTLTSSFLQDNFARNICSSIQYHPFVECRSRSQSQSSDDEPTDSRCKAQLCCGARTSLVEKLKDASPDEDCVIVAEVYRHSVSSNITCRKRLPETWINGKVEIQDGNTTDIVSHTCDFSLANTGNTKTVKRIDSTQSVANDLTVASQKKCAFLKNIVSTSLPAGASCKPAEVNKVSAMESTVSLSQKSSRPTVRSIASTTNRRQSKHSSIEHTASLDSNSTKLPIFRRRSKMSMKENRDPRADRTDRALRMCEHLIETKRAKDAKQQGGILKAGTLLKKRRSKIMCLPLRNLPTTGSCKHNGTNPLNSKLKSGPRSRSNSRSRYWQLQSVVEKNASKSQQDNDNDRIKPSFTRKNRSRPLEVMRTLKEIINSSKDDEDIGENALAISKGEETSKSSCTIFTQTSPPHNKNFVETECNTMPYKTFCEDAEVSCYLIGSASLKMDADLPTTEDELVSRDVSIYTIVGPRSVYGKIDEESECSDFSESFLVNEREKTPIEDSTELESCVSTETTITSNETVTAVHEFATEAKTVVSKDGVHQEGVSLKSSDHDDSARIAIDEPEKFTKRLNDHDAYTGSASDLSPKKSCWTSLSLYDYDASCSDSSEEITEPVENNTAQVENNAAQVEDDAAQVEDDAAQVEDAAAQVEDNAAQVENDVGREDTRIATRSEANSIPDDVLVAFQSAAKYARNIRQAIVLYQESLMAKESEKQSPEKQNPEKQSSATSENHETSMPSEDHCRSNSSTSVLSCRSDDTFKSPSDTECRLTTASDENRIFARFSSGSIRTHQSELQDFETHETHSRPEICREEEYAVSPPDEKSSMKLVQRSSDLLSSPILVLGRSLVRLLVHRTREEHALEVLELEEIAEDGQLRDDDKANGTVVPSAIEFVSMISREHLVPLICCVLCILVFSYLQFLFACKSAL